MRTHYRRIAGQNLERLAALSDGIFAVAMTLLVLNLRVPASEAISTDHDLLGTLVKLLPSLITYCMSFLTLGNFWIGQQTQLNYFARSNRHFAWIHLGFLFMVSLTPFSTALLAGFITSRIALVVYWLNILLLGAALLGGVQYAEHSGLVKDDATAEIAAIKRGIPTAQALYAFGALLCIVNTYVSIAVILLVQLTYAIAPRIRLLDSPILRKIKERRRNEEE
jgi:uncharacterized membrane protein